MPLFDFVLKRDFFDNITCPSSRSTLFGHFIAYIIIFISIVIEMDAKVDVRGVLV